MKYNIIMDFDWNLTRGQAAAVNDAIKYVEQFFPKKARGPDIIRMVCDAPIETKQSLSSRPHTMRVLYDEVIMDRVQDSIEERLILSGYWNFGRINIYIPSDKIRMGNIDGMQTEDCFSGNNITHGVIINPKLLISHDMIKQTLAHELLHIHPVFQGHKKYMRTHRGDGMHCMRKKCLMYSDACGKNDTLCDKCIDIIKAANKTLWRRAIDIPKYMR